MTERSVPGIGLGDDSLAEATSFGSAPLPRNLAESLNTAAIAAAGLADVESAGSEREKAHALARLALDMFEDYFALSRRIPWLAKQAFERREFDIVMLDIAMPCMPGTVLLRRLREIEEDAGRKPALMVSVTAHTMDHEVRAYREVGFDAHVAKPLRIEVIKELISGFIDSKQPDSARRRVRPFRRGRRQGNY
ncbi:MAG: response regulator [Pseudomonadota bacterium]